MILFYICICKQAEEYISFETIITVRRLLNLKVVYNVFKVINLDSSFKMPYIIYMIRKQRKSLKHDIKSPETILFEGGVFTAWRRACCPS